ncbi:MAG: Gfo/Idh/MocA family oxidoreductase [Clostridia bacterium]|nr:Gfo/Idh/MocA family oxidoreductase [Clostridia bacterium]
MGGKIKFGLVGCGRISYKHIEALASFHNDAELICVCDIVRERASKKAEEYIEYLNKQGVGHKVETPTIYTDIDEMLKMEKIDAISICTPSGLHPDHGIKAAQAGVHVITEKPMATNLKKADELITVCDASKVKLLVVKQNRLNSTMQFLKRAVDKGRFGKIYMLLVNVLWARPQEYYNEAKWRGTWEFDGGAFSNQASHYIDSLEWLGGPVESVTAITGTLARKIETEDTGSAVIKFRSGAIGNINVTMLTYPKNFEGSITIVGEKGIAKIGGVALNKIEKWEFADGDDDDEFISKANYEPPNIYGFGHTGYYENVLKVLRNGADPNTDGREGRKSLELIMGIYKSSREGKTIYLPLDLY